MLQFLLSHVPKAVNTFNYKQGRGDAEQSVCDTNGVMHATSADFRIPENLLIEPEQLTRGDPISSGTFADSLQDHLVRVHICSEGIRWKIQHYRSAGGNNLLNSGKPSSLHSTTDRVIGIQREMVDHYWSIWMVICAQLMETRKRRLGKKVRPFELHEEELIISKIALGMAYLHSRGLVHRDLKPEICLPRSIVKDP